MSSENSEPEGSDMELQAKEPKNPKKPPNSSLEDMQKNQEVKKVTTKEMIHQALIDLKSRKGVSLYAIKKYIEEKYKVDVEKLNYIIKKSIKTSVEAGAIVQTKGIGASGSFKLAPGKDKPEKKKKKPKIKKSVEKPTKPEKPDKPEKPKKSKSTEKMDSQKSKKKNEPSNLKKSVAAKVRIKNNSEKATKEDAKKIKTKPTNTSKGLPTPIKKKSAMMKRKSIGSIIKPPKMNPKKG